VNKLAIAFVFAVFATLVPNVYAGVPGNPLCCACLSADLAQTSGNVTAQTALFCAPSAVGSEEELALRCAAMPGDAKLTCFNTVDNSSCSADLAGVGIRCPGSTAAAPAASPLNLATLAVSLAAVGALLLHRRRRA